MNKEKVIDQVKINGVLDLVITNKHCYLVIGGYGMHLNLRIIIDDLWVALSEYFNSKSLSSPHPKKEEVG